MKRPADEALARRLAPGDVADKLPLTEHEHEFAVDAVTAALAGRASAARDDASSSRRPMRWVLAAAAMVLVGAAALFALRPRAEEAVVVDRGAANVTDGEHLGSGKTVHTDAGGKVSMRFAEGTTLEVGALSELQIQRVGRQRRFSLAQGHFVASVVKLHEGEQFVVETARGTVEVWGTKFAVDVVKPSDACPGGSTKVSVDEGVVSVSGAKGSVLLRAGEQHQLPCDAVVETEKSPEVAPVPKRTPPPASSLAKMNALYQRAMTLKQQGQLTKSADTFRELRSTFPLGPLDEAAAVEELRLLERLESPRARAAAKAYLVDYPAGYARDVAERLAEEP